MGMKYVTGLVEDEGNKVEQVFFHDPDGYMIEICNCENIPILPVSNCPSCLFKPNFGTTTYDKIPPPVAKCGLLETIMMESLRMEMMNFSFWKSRISLVMEARWRCIGCLSLLVWSICSCMHACNEWNICVISFILRCVRWNPYQIVLIFAVHSARLHIFLCIVGLL